LGAVRPGDADIAAMSGSPVAMSHSPGRSHGSAVRSRRGSRHRGGRPFDQRRVTPAEQRALMTFASERLARGMTVCLPTDAHGDVAGGTPPDVFDAAVPDRSAAS
jgi:hypothetical protein